MAKRLAIEWDSRELRIVAGTVRGERVSISDVITVPIESSEPQALGETLKRVLGQAGLEKLAAGVALGRGKTELRELKLPPVPDAELPDMVRFQAIRSFATAGEKSAIDYIPTRTDSDGIRVVAASVSPDELKRCALVAIPSQTSVERLILRPMAAASLFRSRNRDQAGETILIDLLADDADIVVLRDDVPVFVRSIKLPEATEVRVRTLAGEIRRSVMASQDSGTDTNCPRRVVLWGRADIHREEVEGLSNALNTTVETLDPFSLVDVEPKLKSSLPEHVGRLAPLIGVLDSDARSDKDLIDFLNPRRPPEPPSPVGRYVVIGAAAAALVGVIAFFGWKKISNLDADIAARQMAYAELESAEKRADEAIARTEAVDSFLDGNVIWLDELRRVALELPPADEVILESVIATADRTGGGSLTLVGNATSTGVLGKLEEKLRDENHIVVGRGSNVVRDKAPYNFSLNETVSVQQSFVRAQRLTAEDAALLAATTANDSTSSNNDKSNEAAVVAETSPSDLPSEDAVAETQANESSATPDVGEDQQIKTESTTEPETETVEVTEATNNDAEENEETTTSEQPQPSADASASPVSEETR